MFVKYRYLSVGGALLIFIAMVFVIVQRYTPTGLLSPIETETASGNAALTASKSTADFGRIEVPAATPTATRTPTYISSPTPSPQPSSTATPTLTQPPPTPTPVFLAGRIPVLEYHHPSYKTTGVEMTPEWFLEQMEWLADNGFHSLDSQELLAYLDGKKRPPQRSVILRFDAGLPDMSEYHTIVMPALRKYGFHAFMFVLVNAVKDQCEDKGKPILCWEQLRSWEQEGLITVGSHGMYHPNYAEIPLSSAKWDAGESKRIIERNLRHEIDFFTYPFDAVPKSTGFVEALGYKAAFAGHRNERSLLFMDRGRYAIPSYYPYSVPEQYPKLTTATNSAGQLATFPELMLEAISPASMAAVPTAIPMSDREAYLSAFFNFCSYYRGRVQAGELDFRDQLLSYAFPSDISNATRMLLPSIRVFPTCNFTPGNIPAAIVLHYTQGDLTSSKFEFLTDSNKSVHYLVDLNGDIVQMVPEQWAAHHVGCSDSLEACVPNCPICKIGDRFVPPWNRVIGIEIVNEGTLVKREDGYYTRSGEKYEGEVYEYTGSMHGIYHYQYWAAFPPEQLAALELLIEDIRSRYTGMMVVGHSEIDFKVDPGPALEEFIQKYRTPRALESGTSATLTTPIPPPSLPADVVDFSEVYAGPTYVYRHPSKLFEINLPTKGEVSIDTNGISLDIPSETWFFSIHTMPVSFLAPQTSPTALVEAYEHYLRLKYPGYQAQPVEQEESSYVVSKQVLRNGQKSVLKTCYFTNAGWQYMLDIGLTGREAQESLISCQAFIQQAGFRLLSPTGVTWWPFTQVYTGYNDLFRINVPYYWQQQIETGQNSLVTRFLAPGAISKIEIYAFSNELFWEKRSAGNYVVDYLANTFGPGLEIIQTTEKRDQRTLIDWRTPPQSLRGLTIFEIRGSTILIVTFLAESSAWQAYYPVFDFVSSSYRSE